MQINTAGLAIIKEFEGLILLAEQDPAGIWSIGYGHTPAEPGEFITEKQADALLAEDVAKFDAAVSALVVKARTSENQFSAMVCLTYNIGPAAFRRSTLLRFHNAGNFPAAASQFAVWDKAHVDGHLVVLPGLVKRRAAEEALYVEVDDHMPVPGPFTEPDPVEGA